MPFTNDEVGFERGATKLVLEREPRDMNRHDRSGPSRIAGNAINGAEITVEYHQPSTDWKLKLRIEKLTEADTLVLREIGDGSGPLTVKKTRGVSTTYTATIARLLIEPVIGHFTDGAVERIKYHRAELDFAILETIT